jgi:hypothetical protein
MWAISKLRSIISLRLLLSILVTVSLLLGTPASRAQEEPYFVADSHHLLEPGDLEFSNSYVSGIMKRGREFTGGEFQLEYRLRKWWVTEIGLDGQSTLHESTIFTGYSWVNRFRPFPGNHWVNPVLSVGWEDTNAADKTIAEIEGHGEEANYSMPNDQARKIREREIETKLILSRDHKGCNLTGNVLAAKELGAVPWQFGYALGVSRPLSTKDADEPCNFCLRRVSPGIEFYGGLGDAHHFGLHDTSHYAGPAIAWELSNGVAFKASANFGLTPDSQRTLIHFAVVYGIPGFGRRVRSLFH